MSTIPTVSTLASLQYAMTVLVPDVEDAQRLAAALDEVRRPKSSLTVIAVPPVRGLAFFADAERQEKIDRWWSHAIPHGTVPVYVLIHDDGVAAWLPGLDGHFIVGVPSSEAAAAYGDLRHVTLASGASILDVALAAVAHFSDRPMFREDATARLEKRLRRPEPDSASPFRRARLRPADEAFQPPATIAEHPIPNVPPGPAGPRSRDGAPREEIVRSLADTLRRLQRIRGGR